MAILQGIQVPFTFNEFGGVTVADPLTKIKNNIQMILCTLVGTRIMEPLYGSTIPSQIGELLDPSSVAYIKQEVIGKLSTLEKNVKVLNVSVEQNQELPSNLQIYIRYLILSFNVTDETVIQV